MKIAFGVTALIALSVGFSFREAVAGTPQVLLGLGVPYLVLGAYALYRMYDDGTLLDVLRPKRGDVTIAFISAAALFGCAYFGRNLVQGSALATAWLLRLALQMGIGVPSPAVLVAIVGIAVLEELVWRGLVLGSLSEDLGTRRAWPLTAVLYAVAHTPTMIVLSDPMVGTNPLVVFAALGAGLVWSFMAHMLGRLPPVMISHAAFTYFTLTVLVQRFS